MVPKTRSMDAIGHRDSLLLVEDDHALRRSLCRVLDARAFDVLGVDTLSAARAALASGVEFDAVLFDVHLPDGSGIDLLREAPASARRRSRWVVTSGAASPSEVATLRALGVDLYLPKPVPVDALVRALSAQRPAA